MYMFYLGDGCIGLFRDLAAGWQAVLDDFRHDGGR